jgi:hypothetical protein
VALDLILAAALARAFELTLELRRQRPVVRGVRLELARTSRIPAAP